MGGGGKGINHGPGWCTDILSTESNSLFWRFVLPGSNFSGHSPLQLTACLPFYLKQRLMFIYEVCILCGQKGSFFLIYGKNAMTASNRSPVLKEVKALQNTYGREFEIFCCLNLLFLKIRGVGQ